MSRRVRVCVISIQSAFCILLVVIIVLVGIQIHECVEYQRLVSLGDKYLEEMDYENAILLYQKAIEISSKRSAGYVKLAVVYMNTGEYETAEEVLKLGVENSGDNARIEELQATIREYQTPEKVAEREEEMLMEYLKDTLIPQKGLAELGPVQGVMYSITDSWYSDEGILSASTDDLDKDGHLELLVFSIRDVLEWNDLLATDSQKFTGYQIWIEVYEIIEKEVSLADEIHLQQDRVSQLGEASADFRENQWMNLNYYATIVEERDNSYIFVEESDYSELFADSSSRNYWIVEYANEKIQCLGALESLEPDSVAFNYVKYRFENGEKIEEAPLYKEIESEGETYEEAVQKFFMEFAYPFFVEFGIETSFTTRDESVLVQRETMKPILDYKFKLAYRDEYRGTIEMQAVDHTCIRLEKIPKLTDDIAKQNVFMMNEWINKYGTYEHSDTIEDILGMPTRMDDYWKKIYEQPEALSGLGTLTTEYFEGVLMTLKWEFKDMQQDTEKLRKSFKAMFEQGRILYGDIYQYAGGNEEAYTWETPESGLGGYAKLTFFENGQENDGYPEIEFYIFNQVE